MIDFERSTETVMLDIFRGCIETGVFPVVDSPCYVKLTELIDIGSKPPIPTQPHQPSCV